jgi:hypothetical protein
LLFELVVVVDAGGGGGMDEDGSGTGVDVVGLGIGDEEVTGVFADDDNMIGTAGCGGCCCMTTC